LARAEPDSCKSPTATSHASSAFSTGFDPLAGDRDAGGGRLLALAWLQR